MTNQSNFLRKIIEALEAVNISYMISGSLASSFHGHPRATNDTDIIIDPTETQLEKFIHSLEADYYVNSDAAKNALRNKSMFNIIDMLNGWKADLIIKKNRSFSKKEFQRKQRTKLMGINLWMAAPEDVILSKLEWAKNTGSERQFTDALGVAATQFKQIDLHYLSKWAAELKIDKYLKQLIQTSEKLSKNN